MKLSEIAKVIGAEFHAEDRNISAINSLTDAKEDEISFISDKHLLKDLETTHAAAIIIDKNISKNLKQNTDHIFLEVDNAYWSMAVLTKYFFKHPKEEIYEEKNGIRVAQNVTIGKNSVVMPGVVIGKNVTIGENCIIYPNVVIYRDCKVGNDCIIHANSVIGSDGFGYATNKEGVHKKVYQNGNVILEDDVEIGSNTSIDRAVFGSTIVESGSKIDNLVHIAHNCIIGKRSIIAGQTGLAGSSKLGQNTVLGSQSGVAGHLEIAPFNQFAARTGITKSVKESGKVFAGFPFMEHRKWLKIQAKIAQLIK